MKLLQLMKEHGPRSMKSFLSSYEHILEAISNFLDSEEEEAQAGKQGKVTPSIDRIFSAFYLVSLDPEGLFPNSLRVVMMFQDTYPTPGCACGVALATLNGRAQPSLGNFYKRLTETYKVTKEDATGEKVEMEMPTLIGGDIRGWCAQGVLLMNAAMTTRENEMMVHMNQWSIWTVPLLKWLSETFPYLVFVFFGKESQSFAGHINGSKHTILSTSHPSGRGYNYGFSTCDIFNEINDHLRRNLRPPIQWEDYRYD